MNNTFSLPKDLKLDLSGFYQSPFISGNVKTTQSPQVNATLRKQFLKNRLTVTFFIYNLFDENKVLMEVNTADFTQVMHDRITYSLRTIGASLSYYFNGGKKVSDKKVETGAAEEKARMR
jgi:outer membrane receptor protein involved in Fe transport